VDFRGSLRCSCADRKTPPPAIAVSTRVQDYLIHSIEIIVDIAHSNGNSRSDFNNSVSSLDPPLDQEAPSGWINRDG